MRGRYIRNEGLCFCLAEREKLGNKAWKVPEPCEIRSCVMTKLGGGSSRVILRMARILGRNEFSHDYTLIYQNEWFR